MSKQQTRAANARRAHKNSKHRRRAGAAIVDGAAENHPCRRLSLESILWWTSVMVDVFCGLSARAERRRDQRQRQRRRQTVNANFSPLAGTSGSERTGTKRSVASAGPLTNLRGGGGGGRWEPQDKHRSAVPRAQVHFFHAGAGALGIEDSMAAIKMMDTCCWRLCARRRS